MSTVQGGPKYTPVTIGNQIWMRTNLNVSTYQNGDDIPQVTGSGDWTYYGDNQIGAWCYYNFDSSYESTYGKLYNWYAVSDARDLAPIGWNIPSSTDYNNLSTYLGGDTIAGGAMKETGTTHWQNPNTGATNNSGFTGVPGGFIDFSGTLYNIGLYSLSWCSDIFDINEPWYSYLDYSTSAILQTHGPLPSYGMSVRCILI